jgi:riboflavin biosynthesis pyrimidine reductase
MSVMANLVIGIDGSTSRGGSSKALSSQEDRRRFHELRKRANAILIGGETARNEPYENAPLPLIVISRSNEITEISQNPDYEIINLEPLAAVEQAKKRFENIIVEGGPNLLLKIIEKIDELYITISKQTGDGQIMSFDGITRDFIMENKEEVDGEIFYYFKKSK